VFTLVVYTIKKIKLRTVWHPGGWDFSLSQFGANFQFLKENLAYLSQQI
jgi:hypothetical protein